MRKQLNLIYNEWMKQFKKMSTKVLLVLVMILGIILPIGSEWFSSQTFGASYLEYELDHTKQELSFYENQETDVEKLAYKYNSEINLLLSEMDPVTDWQDYRYNLYYAHSDKLREQLVYQAAKEGMSAEDIANAVYYGDILYVKDYLLSLSETEQQARLETLTAELSQSKEILLSSDYGLYLEMQQKNTTEQLIEYEKMVAQLEIDLKDVKGDEEQTRALTNEVNSMKKEVIRLEALVSIYEYARSNEQVAIQNTWQMLTIRDMIQVTESIELYMVDEAEHEERYPNAQLQYPYETYVNEFNVAIKDYKETMLKGWYSVQEDIAQLEYLTDGRSVVATFYEVFTVIGVLVSIIIGGAIVSQEFATGTIRLLLIRPVTRTKVMIGKLVTVLLYGGLVLLLGVSTLIVTGGFLYGFETFSVPVLQLDQSTVVEQSFATYMFIKFGTGLSSLVFMGMLALMLSTVLRNTAFAVALSTIIYLGAFPATFILASFKVPGIGLTPLPYINSSLLNLAPEFKLMLESQFKIVLDPVQGCIQLMVGAIIFAIISLIVFKKSDVNN